MGHGNPFDLPGGDVLPPAADAVGHATEKDKIAVPIEEPEIASMEHAAAERPCGRLGIAKACL
jgi:hypothetical protein